MSNTKVLVVDDSALVRDMIRAMIEVDSEAEVVGEASNGLEAVEMVRRLRPDIVTMDIDMPVMDGLQAIERIMAENAVPILVVTSRGDAKTAFAAISKGALDLVVKPDVDLEGAHEFVAKLKLMSKVRVMHPSPACISVIIGGRQSIFMPYWVASAQRAMRSPTGTLSCGWYQFRRMS